MEQQPSQEPSKKPKKFIEPVPGGPPIPEEEWNKMSRKEKDELLETLRKK